MNPTTAARTLALLTAGCFAASLACAADAQAPADLLLRNGEIMTPGGWVRALAVRDGVISAVGDDAEVSALAGPTTRVIDLAGAAVLPGLHDTHVHSMFAGLEQFQCRIAPGADPAAILAAVKACAAKLKPGEWLVGGNWVGAVFRDVEQHRRLLDEAAPANPVLLNDEAHHSVWVNTRALELAGITRKTANPPGGIIERDAAGEATGLLREEATRLVESIVPEPDAATRRRALLLASQQMLSFGITSYTEATVRKGDIASFADLSGEGLLKQRVRGCIVWAPGDVDGERLIRERARYARARFATDCVKIFTDGVPLESRTAAMLEPYLDAHGGHDGTGMLMVPQAQLNEGVARFDRAGLHVKFHAAGDAAVRSAIDAVAYARKANGWGGPMHDVGHNSFVDLADVPRVHMLNMAFEFSPYIWYPTPITAVDVRRVVGEQRLARFIPVLDGIDSGALVTRQSPGGSKETIAPEERISLEQAIRMFTESGARLMGQRDRVGAIEPGMHADLVVVERNPFEVPITEVHDTKVRMTFVEGEKVYDTTAR